jgi:site-specific recombinase XerD
MGDGQKRGLGPLGLYVDGFRMALAKLGYTRGSAAGQLALMAHLSRWLDERGLGGRDLMPGAVGDFLQARRAAGCGQWLSLRGMAPLLDYLRGLGVAPVWSGVVASTPAEVLLATYETYLIRERGLATSSVYHYLRVAREFVLAHSGPGRPQLEGLTAAEVGEFVLAGCRSRRVASAKQFVVGMRALLRYLYLAGITPTALAGAVLSPVSRPANWLPRSIDGRQVKRLLSSCDRRTAVGRRNFAVLTLQLRLGLRVAEVAALELRDFDWRRGEVLVRGKGNREERLPLPVDVGEAVADWLRHGRPTSSSTHVFTAMRAPRRALTGTAVSVIVSRAAQRAQIPGMTAHRLRHTAATDLLRGGASLPEVGQVLRHASLLSTAIYAKVDHTALSALARPWPAGAR